MSSVDKILEAVLRGASDANVGFADLCRLLEHMGFRSRIRGSHHLYFRVGIPELINLQRDGSKAKPYQVRQVRQVILRQRLAEGGNG